MLIWIYYESHWCQKERGSLILILLAHFTQHRLGIVNSKGITWIDIEKYLTQKGK